MGNKRCINHNYANQYTAVLRNPHISSSNGLNPIQGSGSLIFGGNYLTTWTLDIPRLLTYITI